MNKYYFVIFAVLLVLCSTEALRAKREECQELCPANYDATCGYNGKCYQHFGNECMLNLHACKTRQDIKKVDVGKCDDVQTRCPEQ